MTGRPPKRPSTGSSKANPNTRVGATATNLAPIQTQNPPTDAPLPAIMNRGVLGYLLQHQEILNWLNLVVAILLIFIAFYGIVSSSGGVFVPFGIGLLGLRFFVVYVRTALGVNLGRLTLPLNLILLVGALACLVIGLTLKI